MQKLCNSRIKHDDDSYSIDNFNIMSLSGFVGSTEAILLPK